MELKTNIESICNQFGGRESFLILEELAIACGFYFAGNFLTELLKVFERFSKFSRAFQSFPELLQVFESFSKFLRASQSS